MALGLVQQQSAGLYNTPGPQFIVPNNALGNMLVVFAAWDVSQQITSGNGVIPSGAVTDNAENWWRLAADSGSTVPGCRAQIWVCANALPVTRWLSFCPQGYVSSFEFIMAELSGLPVNYWPLFDFIVSTSNTNASALTASGTATVADFGLTMAAIGSTVPNITQGGAGWTTIGTASQGASNPNGVKLTAQFGAFAAGAVPSTWTYTSAGMVAALTVGITQASNLPVQINPNFPRVFVETAFGATPGDPTVALLDTAYTDLSSYCIGPAGQTVISAAHGKAYELATPESGTCTIAMNNQAGVFNPSNTSSPFYATFGGQVSLDSPSGWWPLTDLPGSGTAADLSGGGHPGTATSVTFGSFPEAVAGATAALFASGSSSKVLTTLNPSFTALTVECWLNLNGLTQTGSPRLITNSHTDVDNKGFQLMITGTQIQFWVGNNTTSANVITPASTLPASGWVHLAGTYDGSTLALYVNGVQKASTSYSGTLPAGAATGIGLGYNPTYNGDFLNGLLSECAVYPSALSGTRILAHFLSGPTGPVPAAIGTGLVLPGVPLRVSAQFGGRRYPVWAGYVERWPQDWPDMPQWGWSNMIATDGVGVAASVNLPSAVQGEINADSPYFCFPFSEQYTTSQNTLNGVSKSATATDGLLAVNTSPTNQNTATYIDGPTQPVVTGQSLGLLGDSGTGMGAAGFSGVDTSGLRGPGVQYGPDPNLPTIQPNGAGDITFEFWFTVPSVTLPGSQQYIQLFEMLGVPYLGSNVASPGGAGFGGGVFATAGITLPTALPVGLFFQGSWNATQFTLGNTVFGSLHHLLMIFSQTQVTFWLDGVNLGVIGSMPDPVTPIGFAFGLATYAFGSHGANSNYALAYATLYPYVVQASRIAAHYQSGIAGFSGDTQIQRAGRYIAWSRLNLGLAGPAVADHLQLSSAYSTAGSPLAAALNADSTSSGGIWFVNNSGNLVVLPRAYLYDRGTSVTFGENVAGGEVPYQPDTGFDFDNTYLQNSVQSTLQQGPNTLATPVIRSPSSVGQYFQRGPLQQNVSALTVQDAADRSNWSLNKYVQPSLRVRQMKVNLASRPATAAAVLQTGLSDTAVVNRRPLSQGSYSLPVVVGKIQHDIGPGKWEVTYQMYPNVPESTVLETDTATFDVLGSNALAW